jgi:NADPH-dependent glutamate synthase beta subunit-like oxidoreductase/NAD-dependent dihydropyrimidine dehydrogenase PreA subunit
VKRNSYAKFAEYIGLHGGLYFGPVSNDSVWAKILQRLISEEECELGMRLTRTPVSAEDYAKKVGRPAKQVADMLWNMADHGSIFAHFVDGKPYYRLAPYIPGVYEYLMDKRTMDEEMAKLFILATEETAGMTKLMSPVDGGLMKVAPVMKEIGAQQKVLSHEVVMNLIDKYDKITVCDCACRTATKLTGIGCEHPIEDICMQLGPHAEYYVRTGRGRYVTKEEAVVILDRAERAGLVHTVFATEGRDESSYICNCCGCSCSGFKTLRQYGGGAFSASNFRAKIDREKCGACGACVDICPVNAIRLGDGLCKEEEGQIADYDTSYDSAWGKAQWDPGYRARAIVTNRGTAPCKAICPAHISVQGYIRKASEGKYMEALELIKKDNPFPAVCGRICPHPCESECTRGEVDEPLAIDAIKMFIADQELDSGMRFVPKVRSEFDGTVKGANKVAVVGAGPAGLSCAYFLAVEGYRVTVLEKERVLGGMLTFGIPAFRLDKDVIDAEIGILKELGVEFRTGVEVGRDVTLAQLRAEGFNAFYLAIGAQKGSSLGLEGEELDNVANGVEFLRGINLGQTSLEGPVVVIGGGNVAIDVARSAIRAGAESVDLYCLEGEAEMPALPEERQEARDEGIAIHNGWGPKRILAENGLATALELKGCVSVFDAEGSFRPVYDEGKTITVPASHILLAVGQSIDWGRLLDGEAVELDGRNRAKVAEVSFQTAAPDIFAGGDAVTGPKFAIDAIATGKQGALSIHRHLQGRSLLACREREFAALDRTNLDTEGYDRIPRQKTGEVDHGAARRTFADLRTGLSEGQIRAETQRCLHCGLSVVDTRKCVGCGLCSVQCGFDAIHLERVSENDPSATFGEFYKRIAKYAIARAGRIIVKDVKRAFRPRVG